MTNLFFFFFAFHKKYGELIANQCNPWTDFAFFSLFFVSFIHSLHQKKRHSPQQAEDEKKEVIENQFYIYIISM
jgi:hypothetical protein